MTQQGTEFENFVVRFRRLKDWIDDDPTTLVEYAKSDSSIQSLCWETFDSYLSSRIALNTKGASIYENVDPVFIQSAREFEQRYETYVSVVCFNYKAAKLNKFKGINTDWDNVIELGNKCADMHNKNSSSIRNNFWLHCNEVGEWEEKRIMEHLKLANQWLKGETLESPHRVDGKSLTRTFIDSLLEFFETTGFDFSRAIRRNVLAPDIYVPTHVSKKFHNQEKIALYDQLKQARMAFIFGSPAGAIALMRSVVELVLSEHYGSQGRDLKELIDNSRGLVRTARASDLHRLRKIANETLHFPDTDGGGIQEGGEESLEKNVVALATVVRDLIEGAP